MSIIFIVDEFDLISVYLQVLIPNDVIRTYLFITNGINQCFRYSFIDQLQININKNKYQATFDLVTHIANFHGHGRSLEFQVRLPYHNADRLPIDYPYFNVNKITLLEMTSSAQCENWFSSISIHHVPFIEIGIKNGQRLVGLGNMNTIKNCHSLIIEGGLCDISDDDLRNFSCTEINVTSPNITQVGMIEHMTKVTRMMQQANDGDEWVMMCRLPAIGDVFRIANGFITPELHHTWVVENINFIPPPAPERRI